MKLTGKQIKVLAENVLEKVKLSKKKKETREEDTKLIKNYLSNRKDTLEEIDALNEKLEKLDNYLEKCLGYGIPWGKSLKGILDAKPSGLPNLSQIEDKIVLESIFETKESLQEFINNLVKEFSK